MMFSYAHNNKMSNSSLDLQSQKCMVDSVFGLHLSLNIAPYHPAPKTISITEDQNFDDNGNYFVSNLPPKLTTKRIGQ